MCLPCANANKTRKKYRKKMFSHSTTHQFLSAITRCDDFEKVVISEPLTIVPYALEGQHPDYNVPTEDLTIQDEAEFTIRLANWLNIVKRKQPKRKYIYYIGGTHHYFILKQALERARKPFKLIYEIPEGGVKDYSTSAKYFKEIVLNVENLDQLLETIRTDLVSFVEQHTKSQGTSPEKTSVLSCTKKISKKTGRDVWAFFCSIINFSVKVQKFMIPLLDGISNSIITFYKGDFVAFLNSDIHSKKVLLTNFKWQWVSKDGKTVNQVGWSHHRILKTYQLVYILQTLKVITSKNQSFEANAKKIYQESKNFVDFVSKFVECFRGEPRIFGTPKLTSQKCFKRYLLFLRWVVGLDPDLHLWTFIPHNDLLPPVDVTVKRVLKRVGVFDREYGCKWADVIRYSDFLKLVSPQNKLWADLYLSRLGIMGICNSKKINSKCEICPFQKFCTY